MFQPRSGNVVSADITQGAPLLFCFVADARLCAPTLLSSRAPINASGYLQVPVNAMMRHLDAGPQESKTDGQAAEP